MAHWYTLLLSLILMCITMVALFVSDAQSLVPGVRLEDVQYFEDGKVFRENLNVLMKEIRANEDLADNPGEHKIPRKSPSLFHMLVTHARRALLGVNEADVEVEDWNIKAEARTKQTLSMFMNVNKKHTGNTRKRVPWKEEVAPFQNDLAVSSNYKPFSRFKRDVQPQDKVVDKMKEGTTKDDISFSNKETGVTSSPVLSLSTNNAVVTSESGVTSNNHVQEPHTSKHVETETETNVEKIKENLSNISHSKLPHRTVSPSTPNVQTSPAVIPPSPRPNPKNRTTTISRCIGDVCNASRMPYGWSKDSTWALLSLSFLLIVLTFAVLYSGLYKERNSFLFPDFVVESRPRKKRKIDIKELIMVRVGKIPKLNRKHTKWKRPSKNKYMELPLMNGKVSEEGSSSEDCLY